MRKRVVIAGATAVALAGAGTATVVLAGDDDGGQRRSRRATGSARVERRDLVEREQVSGTLTYAGDRKAVNGLAGTLTGLPHVGARIGRGEALYRVDDRPVPLFYGNVPAWRRLRAGAEGIDVRELEQNLAALGYAPGIVDGVYSSATTAAVKRWQADIGRHEDGVVELGEAIFLPGERRVQKLDAGVGEQLHPGAPVLETTSTRRRVEVDLEADRQDLVRVGDAVEVTMPDGNPARGRITSIGSVAEPSPEEGGDPTLPLTISLRGRAARVGGLDEAPVDVGIVKESAHDVLSVPVTALVGSEGGGYAVEVRDAGAATHMVRVDTGLFADGLVEVSGRGLRPGQRVAVPR
jgi:peptidoglycan hydrolase-like protein with peptidoglycan-binding domain